MKTYLAPESHEVWVLRSNLGEPSEASAGAVVLLHACAHNQTGVDPSEERWRQIADSSQEKELVPLMDSAYQGYASGVGQGRLRRPPRP